MTGPTRSVFNVRFASRLLLTAFAILAMACGNTARTPLAPSASRLDGNPAVSAGHVEICHRTEGATAFIPLSVAAPAVDAHLAHGDGLVGGAVPGMPGMNFGADCAPVAVVPTLDQSNITYLTFGGDGAPGSAVNPNQSAAQTFTAGLSGVLARIDLGIYRDPAAVDGDVTLDILPYNVLPAYEFSASLYTTTIPIASIPLLTLNLTSIDVSSANLPVTAGEQFAIVLRRPSGTSWVVWQDSDYGSPYERGSFFTWHPGWTTWRPVSGDHRFRTWVIQ